MGTTFCADSIDRQLCARGDDDRHTCKQVRAMQIIDGLETTKRGPYGGGIGVVGFNGAMDMALALRTMVVPVRANDCLFDYHGERERREWLIYLQVLLAGCHPGCHQHNCSTLTRTVLNCFCVTPTLPARAHWHPIVSLRLLAGHHAHSPSDEWLRMHLHSIVNGRDMDIVQCISSSQAEHHRHFLMPNLHVLSGSQVKLQAGCRNGMLPHLAMSLTAC